MSGQIWATDSLGGYMYSDELSDVLRMALQPAVKFRQFADAKDASEKGLHKGDKFYFNKYSDVADDGGSLDEREAMPETNFTVSQTSLTITEYGNSVPYSGKLDDLSKQPVEEIINKVLKHDAVKVFDRSTMLQFDACLLRATPTSGTSTTAIDTFTDATSTTTNNVALGTGHVKAIVDYLKERNVNPYFGDDYCAIGWPTTYRTFKNSLETIHQYTDTGLRLIFNGEIGRYENVRFMEQTNIAKGGAVDSTTWTTTVADAWDNAKSDWAFFFGEDTVAEGIVIPEEIRGKIPTDYGRSKGIAWYALTGFGIIHDTASECRILKWDSAA